MLLQNSTIPQTAFSTSLHPIGGSFKRRTALFIATIVIAAGCRNDDLTGPTLSRHPGFTYGCDSREYTYEPTNGVWIDEATGDVLTSNPLACQVTLHYPAGSLPTYLDDGSSPAMTFAPSDQSAWSDNQPWLWAGGWVASLENAQDIEVVYSDATVKEKVDSLRKKSASFDHAMGVLEADPRTLVKITQGFLTGNNPGLTMDAGFNSKGQHVIVVTIDFGNLSTVASDPYVQSHGGANIDVVLAHEIYGHALGLAGSSTGCNQSCAISRENLIRDELGMSPRTYNQ